MSKSLHVYADFKHVFKISALSTHRCFESSASLVNGCVDDAFLNDVPRV